MENEMVARPQPVSPAPSDQELRAYRDGVTASVGAMIDRGVQASEIGRLTASAHDALVARLLIDAQAELGPPPCPFAWLVLGSAGRREQTLLTDQDNG